MRALSLLWIAAFIGAATPSPALARDDCERPEGRAGVAPRDPETPHERGTDAGHVIASVELGVGLSDAIQTFDASSDPPVVTEQEAESTQIITPVVEWPLGRSVFIGGGLRIVQTEDSAAGFPVRRSIMNPVVRLRLSFPIYARLSADALFDAGVALWSSAGQRGLVGWSQSAAVGPAIRLTDALVAYVNGGLYGASANASSVAQQPQGAALTGGPQPTALRSVQVTIGVRTGF